jgi:hypothetical protein
MKLQKQLFLSIISSSNPTIISTLDRTLCGCGYCYHWVFRMESGKFNPMLTEMDAELKDVATPEQLYDFIKHKANDIQGQQQAQV